jgi:hypothetical protein
LCKTLNVMVVVGGIGNTLIGKKRNNSYKMLNLIRQYVTYFTTCQKKIYKMSRLHENVLLRPGLRQQSRPTWRH